jgi:hypothetical protein
MAATQPAARRGKRGPAVEARGWREAARADSPSPGDRGSRLGMNTPKFFPGSPAVLPHSPSAPRNRDLAYRQRRLAESGGVGQGQDESSALTLACERGFLRADGTRQRGRERCF